MKRRLYELNQEITQLRAILNSIAKHAPNLQDPTVLHYSQLLDQKIVEYCTLQSRSQTAFRKII